MKEKKSTVVIIVLLSVLNIILAVGMICFIHLYYDVKEPKFGYYLDRKAQITNIDLIKHNRVLEYFAIGEYDEDRIIALIEYISANNRINYDNEYLQLTLYLEEEEYVVDSSEMVKLLSNQVKNNLGKYFSNVEYNDETGFINTIIIKHI